MNKWHQKSAWGLLAAAISLALVIGGCGASTKTFSMDTAPAASAASMSMMKAESPTGEVFSGETAAMDIAAEEERGNDSPDVSPAAENRKIIRHSSMTLETLEFDSALEKISGLVAENGGYIESQSLDGRSIRSQNDYYERYATVTARVPSEKLDTVTQGLGGICNVVSKNETMEDISDRYFDSQAHLKTLNIQEERLLALLEKAEKLEDVVTLEQALSQVRYEIESLTASLRRMDSQVTYSYLNLELREVAAYKQTAAVPKTFGQKLGAAASRSMSHLTDSAQGLILFLVEALPALLLWAAIALGLFLLIRRMLRRLAARRLQKKQDVAAKTEEKNDSL